MTPEQYPKITLEAARVNAHMNQSQACEALGISIKSLQNYEQGKRVPKWDLVQRFEEVYKFPANLISFAN